MRIPIIDAVRQNHALEHATVAVLVQQLGPHIRLMGRSTQSGFYIYGDFATSLIEQSVEEGLRRLKGGEAELAVSPQCGTNLAVAGVLAGISSIIALGRQRRRDGLSRVILAATMGVMAAQPLGRMVQKHVTTSPDLDGVYVRRISASGQGQWTCHKVETGR